MLDRTGNTILVEKPFKDEMNSMPDLQKPLVSICCLTYNHEKYLHSTIESFLIQEVDFPFEIVFHDDASLDKTQEIIRDYEKKHPTMIRAIYQKENQYSQGARPSLILFQAAKGKYIAFCEGDDYWTDPHKLQKQVDFLKNHPECTICGHTIKNYYEANQKFGSPYPKNKQPEIFGLKLYLQDNFLTSLSLLFKSEIIRNVPDVYYQVPFGDQILKILCAERGKIGFINQVMGVYRVHNQSLTQRNRVGFIRKQIKNTELISNYLASHEEFQRIFLRKRVHIALSLLTNRSETGYKLYLAYIYSTALNFRDLVYIESIRIPWVILWFLKNRFPKLILFLRRKFNIVGFEEI